MARRRGFTAVEMLTVAAIIATLIGLLLPAVMLVRMAARATQCRNNLLQLGVALGNYASTHNVLPPGVVNDKGPISNFPRGYHVSWTVQILPFIEHGNAYRRIDFRRGVYDDANSTALAGRLNAFLCPADLLGVMNYAGCYHDVEAPIDVDNHGVLYLNSHIGYDEITDGPATTILLGEIQNGLTLGWASGTRATLRNTGHPINTPDPASLRPGGGPGGGSYRSPALSREEIESLVLDQALPFSFVGGFGSRHLGGAHFLFCDGSVHFLKQSINPRVYGLLGNRADGELVGSDRY